MRQLERTAAYLAVLGQGPCAVASNPYLRTDGFGLVRSLNVLPVVLLTKCGQPQAGQVTAS
jgi:hypothetical protein